MSHLYDLIIVAGLFVAAGGCGTWLLKLLKLESSARVQYALFAIALGLGVLGYVSFFLGVAGQLTKPLLASLYLAFLGVGISGWFAFARQSRLSWWRLTAGLWPTLIRLPLTAKLLVLFVMLLGFVNLLAALAPVIGVDELIYRVAAADIYLRHEKIHYLPSLTLHQQPQHLQMVQLWTMSLGSDSTTQIIQWAVGLFLVVGIVELARKYLPITVALTAGAVFYAFSDVVVLSGRASPDLGNGLFMFLALIAFANWMEKSGTRWLLLAGILAGLFAAGSRLPGAYAAVGLSILVLIYGWRRFTWPLPKAVLIGVGVGLVAFITVAPWYAKSLLQAGSPTWPYLQPIFGAKDWTDAAYSYYSTIQEREIGQWLSVVRSIRAPWDFTIYPGKFNSGIVGPLLLATLPALLVFPVPKRLKWILVAALVLVPLWYISYPRLRALMPIIALLSILSAYVVWATLQQTTLSRWVRYLVFATVALWMAIGLASATYFHLESIITTLGIKSEQEFLRTRLREPDMRFEWYDDYQAMNAMLPKGSRLLIYESRGYYLDFDYERYDLIARREEDPERLRDPDYVEEKVKELAIDYVLLWPGPKYASGYGPSQTLEDTLFGLCGQRWPIVYRSDTMITCSVSQVVEEQVN
ncbi:MAG: hypothetical protein FJ312_03890 [SAR202 cluster bacterium]|nr:hypothetical protein [SAR202 cluster bacterium]